MFVDIYLNRHTIYFTTKYFNSAGLCSELSSPTNGQVTWTGLTSGSTATYTCNSDYQLIGEQNRTCLSTGMWSGQEPTCESMYSHSIGTNFCTVHIEMRDQILQDPVVNCPVLPMAKLPGQI